MTAGPGAQSRAWADGFYLWRPPDYATASVAVHAGDGIHVLISTGAPGAVFGLARSQAGRPPNVVKQAARMIRLLVDATAAQVIR